MGLAFGDRPSRADRCPLLEDTATPLKSLKAQAPNGLKGRATRAPTGETPPKKYDNKWVALVNQSVFKYSPRRCRDCKKYIKWESSYTPTNPGGRYAHVSSHFEI